MKLIVTLVTLLLSANVFAGGIILAKKYTGTFPLNGQAMILEIPHEGGDLGGNPAPVTLQVSQTQIQLTDSKIKLTKYSGVEALFEIRNSQGVLQATLITEPPCTQAQTVALIFPSGLTTVLQAGD